MADGGYQNQRLEVQDTMAAILYMGYEACNTRMVPSVGNITPTVFIISGIAVYRYNFTALSF